VCVTWLFRQDRFRIAACQSSIRARVIYLLSRVLSAASIPERGAWVIEPSCVCARTRCEALKSCYKILGLRKYVGIQDVPLISFGQARHGIHVVAR
jgi:hypothetical protein